MPNGLTNLYLLEVVPCQKASRAELGPPGVRVLEDARIVMACININKVQRCVGHLDGGARAKRAQDAVAPREPARKYIASGVVDTIEGYLPDATMM
eukprot:6636827-Prymnesium_polylepis.1